MYTFYIKFYSKIFKKRFIFILNFCFEAALEAKRPS